MIEGLVRPTIAVTLGDPRGIGPEITRKALDARILSGSAEVMVVGPTDVIPESALPEDLRALAGETSTEEGAGRSSARALERAVAMALNGTVQAIVTAPVSKPALHAAGWKVPGQTEMLQQLTGSTHAGMLMAAERTRLGGPLRVLLATTHIPLREVPESLTEDRIVAQATLLFAALRRDWSIDAPRLALCALNPHASDGGLFGDEEERVMRPALVRLAAAGIPVTGPVPADTVFHRALGAEFDAVVAPYHDVGMAAFKTVSFHTGVNVSLGLPFVRTSPDHGTAFDIAGRGVADASSMIEAIRLAARLTAGRMRPF